MEAGSVRDVEVAIDAVGIGDIANTLMDVPSDKICNFEGFIAAKSLKNQRPLFHITGFTLIE